MLKRTKKGFTLAELLIVVAIIAVLTAIAVPLFVTSLKKAEKAAFDANKDVVRQAGIVAILSDESLSSHLDDTNMKTGAGFKVTASTDKNGQLQSITKIEFVADISGVEETTFEAFGELADTAKVIVVAIPVVDVADQTITWPTV